jgi:hypothetical protein
MMKGLDSSVGKRVLGRGLHSQSVGTWFPTTILRTIAEFTKHGQHGLRREIRQIKNKIFSLPTAGTCSLGSGGPLRICICTM